mmetsp:Transcript_59920/g.143117  ORF Transcript_59920/g.143117 Transcript_59920/m.143117 type:complete len:202 (+) Transcript_59920:59-664(+)
MASPGIGQRMSRAVSATVPHSFAQSLDKFQRVHVLHITPVSQVCLLRTKRERPLGEQVTSMNPQDAELDKSIEAAIPRRRVAPVSSPENGAWCDRSSTSEGPASSRGTPTFGGLAGIEESQEADGEPEDTSSATLENGKKVLCETEACMILQRWWKNHKRTQEELFDSLVLELMELRKEAALGVQRTWRAIQKSRAQRANA